MERCINDRIGRISWVNSLWASVRVQQPSSRDLTSLQGGRIYVPNNSKEDRRGAPPENTSIVVGSRSTQLTRILSRAGTDRPESEGSALESNSMATPSMTNALQ